MKMTLLAILLFLVGCSTSRLVVERKTPAKIALNKTLKTVEIQAISGQYAENFKTALTQALSEHTPLQVIHFQNRNELIDTKLRGRMNRQNYTQADLIIRGQTQEFVEKRMSNGSTQFAATSRLYLQLIKSDSGEVILSDYFIGTSLSNIFLNNSNTFYDGFTDALNSARNVALDKFISQFTTQKSWIEIELIPYKDSQIFKEIKNLISYGKLDLAKEQIKNYIKINSSNDSERGKAIFSLAVIDTLLGHFKDAEANSLQSHHLYPNEVSLKFLEEIERMKVESKRIAHQEKE